MTYATVDSVAVELGRSTTSVTDAESAQWQQWLDDVELDIAARFQRSGLNLGEQVSVGDPTIALVARVERSAVVRKIQNPNGDTSTTVTIDDGSVTRRKEGAGTVYGLDLTDAEWSLLLPVAGESPAAFSVMPS